LFFGQNRIVFEENNKFEEGNKENGKPEINSIRGLGRRDLLILRKIFWLPEPAAGRRESRRASLELQTGLPARQSVSFPGSL
jgi:hypothetical protein